MFSPLKPIAIDQLSKVLKKLIKLCTVLNLQNFNQSSPSKDNAKDKWEPSSKLLQFVEYHASFSNLLKASITKTKHNGDSGSPCLMPQGFLKKPTSVQFAKIAKLTEDMQYLIQEHPISLRPHL